MTAPVTVRAPAKINLHLGVGPARDDGYHQLATVYQAIGLYDDVTALEADDWSVALTAAGDLDTSGVPLDDGARLVFQGRRQRPAWQPLPPAPLTPGPAMLAGDLNTMVGVTPGIKVGDLTAVTGAVAAGDRVVLKPDPKLVADARVRGAVVRLDDAASDEYFASRPRASQIGAWSSPQSEPVGSRAELDARVAEMEERFHGEPVPRPPFWGGWRIVPVAFEFWQGRPDRLHDRFRYVREADESTWTIERLAP